MQYILKNYFNNFFIYYPTFKINRRRKKIEWKAPPIQINAKEWINFKGNPTQSFLKDKYIMLLFWTPYNNDNNTSEIGNMIFDFNKIYQRSNGEKFQLFSVTRVNKKDVNKTMEKYCYSNEPILDMNYPIDVKWIENNTTAANIYPQILKQEPLQKWNLINRTVILGKYVSSNENFLQIIKEDGVYINIKLTDIAKDDQWIVVNTKKEIDEQLIASEDFIYKVTYIYKPEHSEDKFRFWKINENEIEAKLVKKIMKA